MNAAPTPGEITRIWNELSAQQPPDGPDRAGRLSRRVLVGARHDCYLTVDFPGRRRTLTVVATSPAATPTRPRHVLTSGIEMLQSVEPSTNRPGIDLVLVEPSHEDIFTALAADLLDVLHRADPATSDSGLGLVISRIRRWQHLLAGVRPEGISAQAQRGLVGELTLLLDLLAHAGAAAVSAWTGPDPACQDFQFPQTAIEVKTTSAGHPALVRIHGERQLDDTHGTPLHLVTYVLDTRRGGAGVSLPELVDQARHTCTPIAAEEDLTHRLASAGYLPTQAHLYTEPRYTVTHRFVHRVGAGFPRITPTDLPQGVSEVTYTLDLLSAASFTTSFDDLFDLLSEQP